MVCFSPGFDLKHVSADWSDFLSSIQLPVALHVHSVFALQLVVDRLLKKLIRTRNEEQLQRVGRNSLSTLTIREQNVVYYMSGYMSIKKFKKRSQNQLIPEMADVCACSKENESRKPAR